MYDPNANNVPTYKVEDVMVHVETGSSFKIRKSTLAEFWDSFKSKWKSAVYVFDVVNFFGIVRYNIV